ncbi:MAG: sulfotransferase domain-containing protein [Vicingaceae bacterium]
MRSNTEIAFELEKMWVDILPASSFRQRVLRHQLRPVFIVSTGRTGTHFFSHFFNSKFENVSCYHEPKKDIFNLNMAYLAGQINDEKAIELINYYRKHLFRLALKKGHTYIESNNNLSYLIPILIKAFPTCKIIYLTRDGRDFIRSGYSKLTSGKWTGGDVHLLSDKDPRKRLNPELLTTDEFHGKWHEMDRFDRVAWYWSRKNDLILNNLENEGNYRIFRFEELFTRPEKEKWESMFDFMNIRPKIPLSGVLNYVNQNASNENAKYVLGDYHSWSEDQRSRFRAIAGKTMIRLGYPF